MNYMTQFTSGESEYIFQQLEEIRQHVPKNTQYLLEEIGVNQVLLKVKVEDMLFEVNSTADSVIVAVRHAKEKVIQMILNHGSVYYGEKTVETVKVLN